MIINKGNKNIWVYNFYLIVYVSIFSILSCLYVNNKVFTYLIWVVVDGVAMFVYPPLILFFYQFYLKFSGTGMKDCSYRKMFVNLIFMLIVSYLTFYLIFMLGFYNGEIREP